MLTAWGFTTEENRIPGENEIQTLLQSVGYKNIQLNGNQIQIPEGMELDLGAVGKGYAGDEAAETLKTWDYLSPFKSGRERSGDRE